MSRTFTYKTVDGLDLRGDVYDGAGPAPRPVMLWIHGGALILGSRKSIDTRMLDAYRAAGFTIVSIDYRLAPETKLPRIIEDLQDAGRWIRLHGPSRMGVDPHRMAVVGHSAGGYLTLMSGFCLQPRPRALVSFCGYGDIAGPWLSQPDPFYCSQPMKTKAEAYRGIGSEAIADDPGNTDRGAFYRYCRQRGIWPREVAGLDPDAEPKAFDPFCPVRNVDRRYPPTLLLHGNQDTDVPYVQSVMMAKELARAGVDHELITIPGGGHGFDPFAAGVFERVLEFLRKHVG